MRILLLFLVLCLQSVNAQQSMFINSYGGYNSSGVRREVSDAFFYGGLIDSLAIENSYNKLEQRNSFGLQMGLNAQWQSPWTLAKEKRKWGSSYNWTFGAGIHQYAAIQFSKDLFGLTFKGGQPFAGDSLQLSPLNAEQMIFSKIGLGCYDPETHSSFLIHFVSVQQYLQAEIQNGTWYQDPSSAQIELDLMGKANLFGNKTNAYGVALDIDYRFGDNDTSLQAKEFQLLIQNLGFARSSQNDAYQLDGHLSFGAYSFADLQQLEVSNIASQLLDSLGYQKERTSTWFLLPTTIQLSKMLDWQSPQRFEAYYGALFMLRQVFTPMVYAGAEYKVSTKWHSGLGLVYGGFGGLRIQAYSALRWKRSELCLRSDNIALQNGASLFLQFRCDL